MLILFLASAYCTQKTINIFLRRELQMKNKIKGLNQILQKRHFYLNKYDFQLYNLNEALHEQDEIEV